MSWSDAVQWLVLWCLVVFEVGRRVWVWPHLLRRLAQAEADAKAALKLAETMSDLIDGRHK